MSRLTLPLSIAILGYLLVVLSGAGNTGPAPIEAIPADQRWMVGLALFGLMIVGLRMWAWGIRQIPHLPPPAPPEPASRPQIRDVTRPEPTAYTGKTVRLGELPDRP